MNEEQIRGKYILKNRRHLGFEARNRGLLKSKRNFLPDQAELVELLVADDMRKLKKQLAAEKRKRKAAIKTKSIEKEDKKSDANVSTKK